MKFILLIISIPLIPILIIASGFFFTPNYEVLQNQTMFLINDDGQYEDDYLRVITDLRFQQNANMTFDPGFNLFESGK